MSSIGNTIKTFNFAVDINGINQLTVQKVSGLEVEVEAVAHGEGNHDVFTPGRTKYGKVTMENLMPTSLSQNTLWELLQRSRFDLVGSAKQTITVRSLAPDNITTLKTWVLYGAWVSKVSYGELNRTSSDNLMRTAEWTVDEIQEL